MPGGGTFYSAIADLIGSLANRCTTITSFCPALSGIDKQTIRWFCNLIGYTNDIESGGIFVSGGTMANYLSVLTSRHYKLKEPS